MFIYNIKLNTNSISKILIIIFIIVILIIFGISAFKIFSESIKVKDTLQQPNVSYIESNNYTNILKSVHEDLNTYIGQKISCTGYIYRVYDFNDNEFVLARNMIIGENSQNLVVGFLCNYDNAKELKDNTWVEIIAEINEGDYHGKVPVLKIISIKEIEKPSNEFVPPPDNTYIPTSIIF